MSKQHPRYLVNTDRDLPLYFVTRNLTVSLSQVSRHSNAITGNPLSLISTRQRRGELRGLTTWFGAGVVPAHCILSSGHFKELTKPAIEGLSLPGLGVTRLTVTTLIFHQGLSHFGQNLLHFSGRVKFYLATSIHISGQHPGVWHTLRLVIMLVMASVWSEVEGLLTWCLGRGDVTNDELFWSELMSRSLLQLHDHLTRGSHWLMRFDPNLLLADIYSRVSPSGPG